MELGTILINLGNILGEKGDYERAESYVREGLDIYRRRLGEAHPYYALGLNHLARLLYLRGDYAAAEVALAQRRYDEAEPLLLKSYTALNSILGPRDPRTLEARRRLFALHKTGTQQDVPELFAEPDK
jgi:tetratricopeptide (TPR) repeat protein